MAHYQNNNRLESLIKTIPERNTAVDCIGLPGSVQAYIISKIFSFYREPVCIVTSSAKVAETFMGDLRFFLKENLSSLRYFPPYNVLPFKNVSYHNETVARRIKTLYQTLNADRAPVVVVPVESLLQKVVPKNELTNYAELIIDGEEVELDRLNQKLIAGGFTRSTIVEEPGDFCLRGGILDVFSPLYRHPVRIEFFGDMVESLRFFSATSQRTIRRITEAIILPIREAILKKDNILQFINRIRTQASLLEVPVNRVRELVDTIKNEGEISGLESMISIIYQKMDTFLDYLPKNTLMVMIEPIDIKASADAFNARIKSNYLQACEEKKLCVHPDSLYARWSELESEIKRQKPLNMKMVSIREKPSKTEKEHHAFTFSISDNSDIRMDLNKDRRRDNLFLPLAQYLADKSQPKTNTIMVCHTASQAKRLKSLLKPYGIQFQPIDDFSEIEKRDKSSRGMVFMFLNRLSSGFVWLDESLKIVTEEEIFGKKHHRKRDSKNRAKTEFISHTDLKQGDFIVHTEHGIGRYEGLVKLKIDRSTNDFLLLTYKDQDKLYLPVVRMNLIEKYLGVDEVIPVLDKMGGKSWERVKAKVKKSVEKIAGELLKLYATRSVCKGLSFNKPDEYFKEFEAGFTYEETPDQITAINDVLDDMIEPTPMDRLVCGDVGYGKTEVALRASYLAVSSGKQVAMLVPTTILAEQHFATFSERFKQHPVRIAKLSRFCSKTEQRSIISELNKGMIDIVIGTHRLLSKDVLFKDLGLIIIDEEQRFGVKHKEALKKFRKTIDVLALTATPIPRTLHLSLTGIRDISVISTPPEDRQAIITYISELEDAIIIDAVRKELNRSGQIFFVHNNIHSIYSVADYLQKLVPEARLDIAHGKMAEHELEQVMMRFILKEIDMLVCTTIIESGLDIPSANTILINRADRFGLSQMYQLRGRVGRSDEQAYAYLFIPKETTLGKNAQKRLKVLMEYSDLGSGFQIAMSDLKIRGGGMILGASQSGHIAAVGYDMFLRLMEQSINELKGRHEIDDLESEINIPLSAFLSELYIPDIDQRLTAYRKLAKMKDTVEIGRFKEELSDRFGKLPEEASNLLLKIMLKVLAAKAGVKRMDLQGKKVTLYFSKIHMANPERIVDFIKTKHKQCELSPDDVLSIRLLKDNHHGLILEIKNILKEIYRHVNC